MMQNSNLASEYEVIKYYNECWLTRFENGHNPISLAMHLGVFLENSIQNDIAKHYSNEFLSKHLNIPKDKEIYVADFGCGVGGTCLYFAENFLKARIKGVNISTSQVMFANKIKAERRIVDQVEYFISDYSDTKLQTSNFDFVIGLESICHAPDKLRVYKESFRILKPEGVFAIMDYFEERTPENTYEEELLHTFRKGWVVNEYIKNYEPLLLKAGYKNISAHSILDKVYQGIIHSYNKADIKINSADFSVLSLSLQNHYKACFVLKELVDRKLIDYKIVTAKKVGDLK